MGLDVPVTGRQLLQAAKEIRHRGPFKIGIHDLSLLISYIEAQAKDRGKKSIE